MRVPIAGFLLFSPRIFILSILILTIATSCRKEQANIFESMRASAGYQASAIPDYNRWNHVKQFEPRPQLPLKFNNVVILGNSITFTPSNPNGEWKGNWGMAASAADSDYVHRLTVRLKTLNPDCKVTARNIAEFEVDYRNYNIDDHLKDLRDSTPDLLILRIGEDVDVATYDANAFMTRYTALLDYFFSKNSKLTVLGVGPVWNAYLTEPIMKYNAYVSLAHVNEDTRNTSAGLWKTPGIAIHPSDRGMSVICDSIWAGIQRLKPTR